MIRVKDIECYPVDVLDDYGDMRSGMPPLTRLLAHHDSEVPRIRDYLRSPEEMPINVTSAVRIARVIAQLLRQRRMHLGHVEEQVEERD